MTALKTKVPTIMGDILVDIKQSATQFSLALESPAGTEVIVGIPKNKFAVGRVVIDGELVWENGTFISGVDGVSWHSEDSKFIQFKVKAGKWSVVANESTTGIHQNNALLKNNFSVFPNPSYNGKFYLADSYEWKVYSLEGKKTKQGKGTEIDLSDLNKSIYLLKTIDFDSVLLSK
jgi:hypothetical protein